MLSRKPEPGTEKLLLRKYVFEGRAIRVRVDTVRNADGRRTTREIVEHGECIAVVALDPDGNILLVRQYRSALAKQLLEIPAGGIDKGENSEAAVIREMQEETGFKPGKVERLCGFYLTPGTSNEYLHLYLATDLVPSRLHAEDTAGIEVISTPVSQIKELIKTGALQDGKSIAGLLYYLEYIKTAGGTP
jgi:ADP-ribose pyrophosphatase